MKYSLIKPAHYYKEFKQLVQFVRFPELIGATKQTTIQKIKGTWTLFIVKLVLAIVVGVAVGIFYDAENLSKGSMLDRFSMPILFLITILILPLLEEIAFRLSLKFSPHYLAASISVLCYYVLTKGIYQTKLTNIDSHFLERVVLSILLGVVCYLICTLSSVAARLKIFWQNHFTWIFYASCILFAWMHIFNYEINVEHLLLMPLITLDKLVSAFCYGYGRIQYGFLSNLSIHMFNNAIAFLVLFLSNHS